MGVKDAPLFEKPFVNRIRRSNPIGKKRICGIHLIIGYDFFANYARFDYSVTIDHAASAIRLSDRILRATTFNAPNGEEISGFGLRIEKITIDTDESTSMAFSPRTRVLTPIEFLNEIAQRPDHGPHCITHYLAWFASRDGTLALTYLCADANPQNGGICRSRWHFGNTNTGYTSYLGANGMPVPALSGELVMAHELGHSYGSFHDPSSKLCSPPAERGGLYLLNTYAVSGMMPNNYKFSPCSRKQMSTCIFKFGHCLVEDKKVEGFCGNLRIDEDEECDSGILGIESWDACCLKNCKLRPGAQCSPANHACCTSECKIKAANTSCAVPTIISTCLSEGSCSGISPICPGPVRLSNKKCYAHGYCVRGKCTDYCTRLRLKPCQCDVSHSRKYALMYGNYTAVDPKTRLFAMSERELEINFGEFKDQVKQFYYGIASDSSIEHDVSLELSLMHLDDFVPCLHGRCKVGTCYTLISPKDQSLHGIVDLFGGQATSAKFWNNIVVLVLAFSLIVWLPLISLICVADANLNRMRQRLMVYSMSRARELRQRATTHMHQRSGSLASLAAGGEGGRNTGLKNCPECPVCPDIGPCP